ncbi:MAG: 4Fe-4S dicluster domain-containing protein [Gemmatimonadaceae bacterium]|nr:4Fe-4S dicluster domain-containing protein [Gemmatimonadaceae bacterium]
MASTPEGPLDRRGFFSRGFAELFGKAAEAVGERVEDVAAAAGLRFPVVDAVRCLPFRDVACGVCARVCPVGEAALRLDERGRPVIGGACTACGQCIDACVTAPSSLQSS